MTRVIAIASGKGGVGKTTTSVNLGTLLADAGRRVTVVDSNLTTPNVALHLGVPLYPITLHDVIQGRAEIQDAVYINHNGLRIVPGSLSVDDLLSPPYGLGEAIDGLDSDIIILDCAAGLGSEAKESLSIADDLIIITQPDMPSVVDALRSKKVAEGFDVNILGVVVNHYGAAASLSNQEIQEMLELPIITTVPEDKNVQESIALKMPAVHKRPESPASKAFSKLASHITGEPTYEKSQDGFIEKLLSWIRG